MDISQSVLMVNGLQARFGVLDYDEWTVIGRKDFWSYQTYPLAGASQLNFFGSNLGLSGATLWDTNMEQAGQLGQTHLLIKAIYTDVKVANESPLGFDGTASNADSLGSDFLMGFAQAGVLDFGIASRPFATIPKPFMYMPPGGAPPQLAMAGVSASTTAGTVTTIYTTPQPRICQTRDKNAIYRLDPQILLPAAQSFNVTISYPSGLVPVIGTTVITADIPLKVGVCLSGVWLRPVG